MSRPVIKFSREVVVAPEVVTDLLICAFEGGSNYWYDELEAVKETSTKSTPSERFYDNMVTHGFRLVDKETGRKYTIGPDAMALAIERLHDGHVKHFNDAITENTDADTGDVYLQLCCFGEVIYG